MLYVPSFIFFGLCRAGSNVLCALIHSEEFHIALYVLLLVSKAHLCATYAYLSPSSVPLCSLRAPFVNFLATSPCSLDIFFFRFSLQLPRSLAYGKGKTFPLFLLPVDHAPTSPIVSTIMAAQTLSATCE